VGGCLWLQIHIPGDLSHALETVSPIGPDRGNPHHAAAEWEGNSGRAPNLQGFCGFSTLALRLSESLSIKQRLFLG